MAKETDLSLPLELNEHQHVVTGQLVGYARVSTPDQNLDRQVAPVSYTHLTLPTNREV